MSKSTINFFRVCGLLVSLMFTFGWIIDLRLLFLSVCIIVAALGCSALFVSYLSIKMYHEKKAELELSIFGFILGLIISFIAFFASVTVFKSVV